MSVVSSDSQSTTVQADFRLLPVPDRKYSCDAAQIVSSAGVAKLLLAQRKPVGDGLLSMLQINFPAESVCQVMKGLDETFAARARDYVHRNGGEEQLSVFQDNADQSVVLTATMLLAGYTGLSGCMDFYYSSPFALERMAVSRKLAFDPGVRVNLSTGLMLAVFDALAKAATQWKWQDIGAERARV